MVPQLLVTMALSYREDLKKYLEQFFAQKNKKFWEDGIMKLPEKWQKVVEQNGEYIVQFSSW